MSGYKYAVIGGGIVGSSTALHLAQMGQKVLLLEQFVEPHTRGSSGGQSRIIRSYYEQEFFTKLMSKAFRGWKDMEKESGNQIIVTTGALCIAKKSSTNGIYDKCLSNIARHCPEHLQELTPQQLDELFGSALCYSSKEYRAFMDKSGGVILANKALETAQMLFRKYGGEVWDGCQVNEIKSGECDVTLMTSRGKVIVEGLVVCAGAWTAKLLTPSLVPSLPLHAESVKVFYWKERVAGTYSPDACFPAFLDISSDGSEDVYGLPSIEYPGLIKICIHGGVPCDPDARDKVSLDPKLLETLKKYIQKHFPMLEPEPSIIESCMYTVTPDEVSILDVLPDHPNIVIGTGFSGTGFKTAPIIGKLLAELVTGVPPSFDISHFRLARF